MSTKLTFLNPCKKCLINPLCTHTCNKRSDFYKTRTKTMPFIILVMSITLSVLLSKLVTDDVFLVLGALSIAAFSCYIANVYWIKISPLRENDPDGKYYDSRFNP